MKIKNSTDILIIVFLIVGIVFVGICAVFTGVNIHIKNNYNETDAVVMGFERHHSSSDDGDTVYTLVSYSVDGNDYQSVLSAYSSSWSVGDTIKVYTNPDNPQNVKSTMPFVFFIVFALVGSVFAIVGIVMLHRSNEFKKQKKQLIENGLTLRANIIDFYPNTRIMVNRRNPYLIVAEYEEFGQKHRFVSENVWERLNNNYIGEQVTVYYEHNNMNKYYVDVDTLLDSKSYLRENVIYH